ncbi:Hypothetical predicted protein [Mytilus galloprovincialis]|uniref:Uncharacterized protein n=1 Tax=Mytilus galloprovincialis TaxID=29158 RepID=A0A8B6CYJ3_MYTGA|nr:Hypothetical predicted protein [Mytilus galloprovincialis]
MIDISKPKEQFYFRFHFQKVNIDYRHINNQIMAKKMGNEMIKPTEENQNMTADVSSDLNRQAEDNQKHVKNLISQLTAATGENDKINKSLQDENRLLRAENKRKDGNISVLQEEVHKLKTKDTKVQKEYHKLSETEGKLQKAEKTIKFLRKENDDQDRNYLKTIQDLEDKLSELSREPKIEEGCFIDHHKSLEDQVKHLTIENKDHRDRIDTLETKCRRLQELNSTLEQERNTLKQQIDTWVAKKHSTEDQVKHLTTENKDHRDRIDTLETKCRRLQELNSTLEQERNTLKQQIDTWVAKKHSTVHIQMYAAVNKELCDKMMTELENMLSMQFELNDSIIEIEKYKDPPPDSRVPLIVICINASRLGTDVNQALSHVNRSRTIAVVVLHHKEYHALPRQPSEKMLIGSDYKHIGAIVDIAYLTTKGVYPCDMNEKSLDRLVNFIKVNSQSK